MRREKLRAAVDVSRLRVEIIDENSEMDRSDFLSPENMEDVKEPDPKGLNLRRAAASRIWTRMHHQNRSWNGVKRQTDSRLSSMGSKDVSKKRLTQRETQTQTKDINVVRDDSQAVRIACTTRDCVHSPGTWRV